MGLKFNPLTQDFDFGGDTTVTGGSDVNYVETFTNQSSVSVVHNLNKKPAVTIIDSAGDEIEGEVNHVSANELTVDFSASFTGSVILN